MGQKGHKQYRSLRNKIYNTGFEGFPHRRHHKNIGKSLISSDIKGRIESARIDELEEEISKFI
jgi:hypothetical protein